MWLHHAGFLGDLIGGGAEGFNMDLCTLEYLMLMYFDLYMRSPETCEGVQIY